MESTSPLISAENIAKRVREMGRVITADYAGKDLFVVGVLQSSFIFLGDLVRAIDTPVRTGFMRPQIAEVGMLKEIFFGPPPAVEGRHVLLVRGVFNTGVTTEFLVRTLANHGAATVRVAALLDRPTAHRTSLHPDYFGFLVDDSFIAGYGLSLPDQTGRNLPYMVKVPGAPLIRR